MIAGVLLVPATDRNVEQGATSENELKHKAPAYKGYKTMKYLLTLRLHMIEWSQPPKHQSLCVPHSLHFGTSATRVTSRSGVISTMWRSLFAGVVTVLLLTLAGLQAQQPEDPYHELHLPHDPPLYPTLREAFHLCADGRVSRSFLCPNATLFHEEYAVCDQFYNVRCGIDRRID
ncbi:hypothetical protein B566_EDAN010525 [Ephemera danica]|nr:hypothetical protein B566_EDAN010525 [Ephemera danica]